MYILIVENKCETPKNTAFRFKQKYTVRFTRIPEFRYVFGHLRKRSGDFDGSAESVGKTNANSVGGI